jgi:DNA-nicking Smr family endonuclease
MKLAVEAGMTPEELALLEKEVSESRDADQTEDAAEEPAEKPKTAAKKKPKTAAKKKTKAMMSFDDESDDDDPF